MAVGRHNRLGRGYVMYFLNQKSCRIDSKSKILNIIFTILYLYLSPVTTANAQLEGPQTGSPNNIVIIKIQNQKINDLKVDCSPKNDSYKLVKFLESNELGILFLPKDPGVYTFAIADNEGGKTSLYLHTITITGPGPGPGPGPNGIKETLTKTLQTDRATKEQIQQLATFYRKASQLAAQNGQIKDIAGLISEMRKIAPEANILANTRKQLDQYFQTKLPKQNIQMSKIIRDNFVKEFTKIADILESL